MGCSNSKPSDVYSRPDSGSFDKSPELVTPSSLAAAAGQQPVGDRNVGAGAGRLLGSAGSSRDMVARTPGQSPANASSRFRSATSFDMNVIQPNSLIMSDLDMVGEFYKLPASLRHILRVAQSEALDVTDDILLDCNNLFKRSPDALVNALYPAGEMTSSSIIRLASKENASDKFLEMIESTYKGTQRSSALGADHGGRVTLIYKNGTSKTLMFNESWKYWSFLRAIKRSYRGINKPVSLDCVWIRHTGIAPSVEKTFWSSFSANSKSASDAVDLNCEVSNGVIWFKALGKDKDSAPPESPVGDVIAISLACDYNRVRNMAMEVSFLSHTWDSSVMGGGDGAELCIQVHHSGRPSEVPTTFSDLGSKQFIYITNQDLQSDSMVVLKVMTDNPNQSVERLQLGKYEFKLNALEALLKGVEDVDADVAKYTAGCSSPGSVDTFTDPSFREVRTLPTLTPFHPVLPAVPLVEHIILSVPDTRRMYKLVVHNVLDLLGGEDDNQAAAFKHKMHCYVVVELYDAAGELLSPANFHKTDVVADSLDPEWEMEFHFPLQIAGKDIESIGIRIKDASGYLRHKTIGYTTIQTAVFVSVSMMALLRLPIEPVDFRTGETITDFPGFDMYGMISIGTQTCPRNDEVVDKIYGGFVDTKGGKVPVDPSALTGPTPDMLMEATSKTPHTRMVRQMSAAGQAVVSFCMRELSVCETCWPYDTLSTVVLDITSGGAPKRIVSKAAPVIPISFGSGHLFAGADHLVTLPGQNFDNSLIRWCTELDPHASLLEPVLRIPWGQVKEIDTITDTSLIITVVLHRSSTENVVPTKDENSIGSSTPVQGLDKFRQHATTSGAPQSHTESSAHRVTGAYEVDILIAPCPAVDLAKIIYERVQLESIRGNVKSFLYQYAAAMQRQGNSHPSTPLPKQAFSFTSAADTLSLAKTVFQVIERTYVAVTDPNGSSLICSPSQFSGNYSPADFLNTNAPARDQNMYHAGAYNPPYATREAIELRLRVMISLLMDVCSAIKPNLPGNQTHNSDSMSSRVIDLLHKEEISATEALMQLEDSCAEKTTKKMEFIIEGSLNMLREAVLCGWDSRFPKDVVKFADALVEQTLQVLKKTLDFRLSDISAFDGLEGFSNKTTLVKYALANNSYFYSSARSIVGVLGLSSAHLPRVNQVTATPDDMLLLNKAQISNVIMIYSTTVVNETKLWLSKTLTHYLQSKSNHFGLPWDVESVGSLCMSPIPETLRFQLNAYMSVCSSEEADLADGLGHPGSSTAVDARSFAMLLLNESIAKAIILSLQLVADEYKLAYKCKRWEDANESNERASNLQFLAALGNDCHRILNVHLPDVLHISSPTFNNVTSFQSPHVNSGSSMSLPLHTLVDSATSSFNEAIDSSQRGIVRLVFSDFISVLFDFETHWLETHDEVHDLSSQNVGGAMLSNMSKKMKTSMSNVILKKSQRNGFSSPSPGKSPQIDHFVNPLETMTMTISDYFRDLRLIMERNLFVQTVSMCAQVCIARYMIFFKRIAGQIQNNSLNIMHEAFISAVEADVVAMSFFFDSCITGDDIPVPPPSGTFVFDTVLERDYHHEIKSKIDAFKKIIILMRAPAVSDPKLQISLRELATVYGNSAEGVSMVENMLRSLSSLRGVETNSTAIAGGTPSAGRSHNGVTGAADFLDSLLDAWGKQLSGVRRQSINPNNHVLLVACNVSDLPNDLYFCAFGGDVANDAPNASSTKPKIAEKKKKDLSSVGLLRVLGLLDPERSLHTSTEIFKPDPEEPSSAAKRRFSATDSLRAAAAFLNANPNANILEKNDKVEKISSTTGEVGNASENSGDDVYSATKKRFSATDSLRAATAFINSNSISNAGGDKDITPTPGSGFFESTSSIAGPVIDVMLFNIKTRNLKNSATFGTVNPFVTISIGKNIPEQKTKVQWNTSEETIWTEDVIFRGVDQNSLSRLVLDINVFDRDRIRGKKLLGAAEIRLGVLDVRSIDSWFALEGGSDGSNGEIHLSIMKRP